MTKLITVLLVGLAGFVHAGDMSAPAIVPAGKGVSLDVKTIMPVTVVFRIKTNDAVAALKDRNFYALARLVDPKTGLRFSPSANIKSDGVVIPKDKVADFLRDGEKRVWGPGEAGGPPIRLTPAEYYTRFIYDADFAAFSPSYNTQIGVSESVSNISSFYPKALFSEFHYPGTVALGNLDWKSLRLVFVEKDYDVYLAAIVHDAASVFPGHFY